MATLSVSEIKDYVKNSLDEYSNTSDASFADEAVEDLERIIDNSIVPAVRKIHLDAPNVLLKEGVNMDKISLTPIQLDGLSDTDLMVSTSGLEFGTEGGEKLVTIDTESSYTITTSTEATRGYSGNGVYMYEMEVPYNFLRLVSLRMSDWHRAIQTLINEDSVEYHRQNNKYLRGTPDKPVGVLLRRAGKTVIALYTSTSDSEFLDYGYYIPEPVIDENDNVWISPTLKYPCLNQIVADTLRSLGEFQKASLFDNKAVQPFYIDPDYARLNPPCGERFNTTNQ